MKYGITYAINDLSMLRGRARNFACYAQYAGVIGMRVSPGIVFPAHISLGMRVSPHIYH